MRRSVRLIRDMMLSEELGRVGFSELLSWYCGLDDGSCAYR